MAEILEAGSVEPAKAQQSRAARSRARRVPISLVVNAALLAALIAVSVLVPLLTSADPLAQNVNNQFAGPSAAHWLGTDETGRDVLSRLIWGTRSAFGGVVIALLVATVVGIPWGLAAGYFGGRVDEVLMRLADALLSFPSLVLAIGITGSLGPSLTNAMIAVGVHFTPTVARLLRSAVLPVRSAEYVLVARSIGVRGARLAMRHILPNSMGPVLVHLCSMASVALLVQTSLSFLGMGVSPPAPSWGGDLSSAYQNFTIDPLLSIAPGLMVSVTAFLLTRLGDSVRDYLGVG